VTTVCKILSTSPLGRQPNMLQAFQNIVCRLLLPLALSLKRRSVPGRRAFVPDIRIHPDLCKLAFAPVPVSLTSQEFRERNNSILLFRADRAVQLPANATILPRRRRPLASSCLRVGEPCAAVPPSHRERRSLLILKVSNAMRFQTRARQMRRHAGFADTDGAAMVRVPSGRC